MRGAIYCGDTWGEGKVARDMCGTRVSEREREGYLATQGR